MSRSLNFVPRLSLLPVATESERENLGTSRVSERVRKTRFAFSAVFGVLEKMAQNVYTFYEEVKKKN